MSWIKDVFEMAEKLYHERKAQKMTAKMRSRLKSMLEDFWKATPDLREASQVIRQAKALGIDDDDVRGAQRRFKREMGGKGATRKPVARARTGAKKSVQRRS